MDALCKILAHYYCHCHYGLFQRQLLQPDKLRVWLLLRLCPEVWLQPSVRPDQWNLDSQGSLCQTRALWCSQFGPSRPPGLLILSPLSGPPPQPYLSTPSGECRASSCQSACWSAPEGERACRPIQADLPSVHQTVQRQADAAQPPGKEPQLVLASQILVINWQLTHSDGDFSVHRVVFLCSAPGRAVSSLKPWRTSWPYVRAANKRKCFLTPSATTSRTCTSAVKVSYCSNNHLSMYLLAAGFVCKKNEWDYLKRYLLIFVVPHNLSFLIFFLLSENIMPCFNLYEETRNGRMFMFG